MIAKHLRYTCLLALTVLTLTAGGRSAQAFQLAQTAPSTDETPREVGGQAPTSATRVLAQAEPPKKAEAPAAKPALAAELDAERLLDQAAKNLAATDWVRAGIRQRVDLFGKRLDGTGTYLKGPNWKMKLELKIALDDRRPPSSLQQVCDGRWLWDYREILGSRLLTKVDVTAVKDALESGPQRPGQFPSQTILGLGGLEQLLRGLRSQFDFVTAGTMKVGDRSFLALRGQWKREALIRMLPEQQKQLEEGKPADLKKLAEYVPDEVLLLLDPKTLFIHRVEYRRSEPETADKKDEKKEEAKGKANRLTGKSLIIMELFDVELGQPADDLNFLYKSDLPAVDRTEDYLKMLKGSEPKPAGK